MSKCHSSLTWDDYESAQVQQQMSIDPTQFFACNPYGNAAQAEHLRQSNPSATPRGPAFKIV